MMRSLRTLWSRRCVAANCWRCRADTACGACLAAAPLGKSGAIPQTVPVGAFGAKSCCAAQLRGCMAAWLHGALAAAWLHGGMLAWLHGGDRSEG